VGGYSVTDDTGTYREYKYRVKCTDGWRKLVARFYGPVSASTNVWCWCSCPYFKYHCEVALASKGSSAVVQSNGQRPRFTNPKMIPRVCKHLFLLFAIAAKDEKKVQEKKKREKKDPKTQKKVEIKKASDKKKQEQLKAKEKRESEQTEKREAQAEKRQASKELREAKTKANAEKLAEKRADAADDRAARVADQREKTAARIAEQRSRFAGDKKP